MPQLLNADVWLQILEDVLKEKGAVKMDPATDEFSSTPFSKLFGTKQERHDNRYALEGVVAERWLSEMARSRSDLTAPCQRLLYSREIALRPGERFARFLRTMTISAHLAARTRRLQIDFLRHDPAVFKDPAVEQSDVVALDDPLARLIGALPHVQHLALDHCHILRAESILEMAFSLQSLTLRQNCWPSTVLPADEAENGRVGLFLDATALKALWVLPELVRLDVDVSLEDLHNGPMPWPNMDPLKSRSLTSLALRIDRWTGKDLENVLRCMPTSITSLTLENLADIGTDVSLEPLFAVRGAQLRHLVLSWLPSLFGREPVFLLHGLIHCTNLCKLELAGATRHGHHDLHTLPSSLHSLLITDNPLSSEVDHGSIAPGDLLDYLRTSILPQLRNVIYKPGAEETIFELEDHYELRECFWRWQVDMQALARYCREKEIVFETDLDDDIKSRLRTLDTAMDEVGYNSEDGGGDHHDEH